MDREDLRRQLMATFKAQLDEHLRVLNRGLLEMEKRPSEKEQATLLAELFRAVHSTKGAARAVDIKDIETISHRMEDVFSGLKKGEMSSTPELIDILLQAVDALGEAMDAHLRGETLPPEYREQILSTLMAALQGELPEPAWKKGITVIEDTEIQLEEAVETPGVIETKMMEVREKAMESTDNSKRQEARGSKSVRVAEAEKRRPIRTAAPSGIAVGDTIRVATEKLDALMAGMGELLVARMRNEQRLDELKTLQDFLDTWEKTWRSVLMFHRSYQRQEVKNPELKPLIDFLSINETNLKTLTTKIRRLAGRYEGDYRHLSLLTDDMQEGVRRVRMVPVSSLFEIFPRMVRDLGREREKEVNLEIKGTDTEVDRQVLEAMKDPLMHLLRNAVDHGIEPPDRREAAGKSRQGKVSLEAFQKGNSIVLKISDDGAGIDLKSIQRAAVEKEFITSADATGLNKLETIDLIYHSGLSTMDQVSDLSGRGIGMDVVRENLEQLHGVAEVDTEPGKGTSFTLTLPLTLATSHVLLLAVAGQTVAVPTTTVERILHIDPADVGSIEGKPAVSFDGRALPMVSMDQVLELPPLKDPEDAEQKIPIIILGVAEKRLAFRVNGFQNTQEVVIKSLGKQLKRVRNVAGATILGTGQVVMILNVAGMIKSAQMVPAFQAMKKEETRQVARRRVLVVDDSITTRTLEKNILENAGYQVFVAADGADGWELIQSEPLDVVVLDVDMPRMNGFELTEKIKTDEHLSKVPVILVTSLESPRDKIKGMEVGADAYITKSTFDQQELLETIERLIG